MSLTLDTVPLDILVLFFRFLKPEEALVLRRVSKALKRTMDSKPIRMSLVFEVPFSQNAVKPSGRVSHVFFVYKNTLFVNGGNELTFKNDEWRVCNLKNDTFEFDVAANIWKRSTHEIGANLGKRAAHVAVVYRNRVFFMGGFIFYRHTNSTAVYDFDSKTLTTFNTSNDFVGERSGHSALLVDDKIYLWGGWSGEANRWFNDMWVLDLSKKKFENLKWEQVDQKGTIPTPRSTHTMFRWGDALYIYGGFSGTKYFNDLHRFDPKTQEWTQVMVNGAPKARSRTYSIVHNEYMYLLGGWDRKMAMNDFYRYNFAKNYWERIDVFKLPTLSQPTSVVFKDTFYIFGGHNADTGISNTLYRYNFVEDGDPMIE